MRGWILFWAPKKYGRVPRNYLFTSKERKANSGL